MDSPVTVLLLVAVGWVLFALACRRIMHNPRGDALSGIGWHFARQYARWYHWLRVRGRGNIPPEPPIDGRPLIIVSNHTAGVDPILIQSTVPYFVRWVMAADMQGHGLDALWKYLEVILVNRNGQTEVAGMREAMRHLKAGGALGIFPEGRLQTERGRLHPFLHGLGLLIARSNALVLPCVIAGTPMRDTAWASLWAPSRSRLWIMPVIDYPALGVKPGDIAADLQARYERWVPQIESA
ncbi:MAG: 1-acyl-sn-glycerol-3-phosphate acyltransferase [Phycisphaeraceae bacterium]|nr:1-acyl-sn-glycerol-3-phosphate acyltransferase [Phycisphaeraceae bacterium]